MQVDNCRCARSTPNWSGSRTSASRGDPAPPKASRCRSLGLPSSVQIVPEVLGQLVGDADSQKSQRAMKALLQMKKLDIAKIKQAYDGERTA